MTELPSSFFAAPLAHRGFHDVKNGRPENSRAAIRAAIESGYGIEIDLQLSADGQAMVFHDYDLSRLANAQGAMRLRSAQELGQIPLKGGDEGIPAFDEVLDLVDGRVPLLIEIKDQDGVMGPNTGTLEAKAAACLAGYAGDAAVMSFNPHAIAAFATHCADRPLGLVTCGYSKEDWPLLPAETRDYLRGIPDFDRVGASFVSHDRIDLKSTAVAQLKDRGIPVLCWTVRSREQERDARKIADNITFEGYDA